MRLWAAYKAKELCTEWNMKMFFKVVYNDVNHCLEQLKDLRVPDLVPADSFEVLVQVCVALRAKLVSEIKVNVNKLKVWTLPTTSVSLHSKIFLSANLWGVYRCPGINMPDYKPCNANTLFSQSQVMAVRFVTRKCQRLRILLFE